MCRFLLSAKSNTYITKLGCSQIGAFVFLVKMHIFVHAISLMLKYRIAFILVIYALMQFHWNQICLNLLQTFSVQFA